MRPRVILSSGKYHICILIMRFTGPAAAALGYRRAGYCRARGGGGGGGGGVHCLAAYLVC